MSRSMTLAMMYWPDGSGDGERGVGAEIDDWAMAGFQGT